MRSTFRKSMDWLHTWAGVVLGGMLFAIFWTGTLSVFDREIDRWMMPMTRLALPSAPLPLEALRPLHDAAAAVGARTWTVMYATEREPVIRVLWQDASGGISLLLNPTTGQVLPDAGTWGGTRFIYPFHYMLQIRLGRLGAWIVGFAAMAMLALCISGVVTHRKVFKDFFSFRKGRKSGRAILDLHNVMGVLALPFHICITLSGLIVFYSVYFSSVRQIVYGDDLRLFRVEAQGIVSRPRVDRAADQVASLDSIVADAKQRWNGGVVNFVAVWHPGDAASYVQVRRADEDGITFLSGEFFFDATTGRWLAPLVQPLPVVSIYRLIAGLHIIHFKHWTLRWLYFALGLAGCVLIATGYLFWLDSRRKRHRQLGLSGVRIVECITIGSVSGIILATLAFFTINRLLPLDTTFAGYNRSALEIWTFYVVWLLTFVHAWLRPSSAWMEQCIVIAALAVAAALLNWITTGDHLARSALQRHLWPIAGIDVMLLVAAAISLWSAFRLRRKPNN